MSAPFDLDALRANTDWMTRLARRLVGDADADDLVQDAWMVALRSDRSEGASPGWLAGVVRNLARVRQRAEARRTLREARAAKCEEAGSTDDLVEQLAAQRQVADAVLALPESVREAILLRYYRGRALREIAAEQDISVAGVHRRIERGHALLRERLKREHGGDGRAWALSLLTLAEPSGGLTTPLGIISMGIGTKIAATLVAAGGALGVYLLSTEEEPSNTVLADVPGAVQVEEAPRSYRDLEPAGNANAPQRSVHEPSTEVSAMTPAPASLPPDHPELPAAPTRYGRVIDLSGAALADAQVVLLHFDGSERQRTRTDAAGNFEVNQRGTWVEVREQGWTTVVPGRLGDTDMTVVAGKRTTVRGWVVDQDGTPLEGASVRLEPSTELYRKLALIHVYSPPDERWSAATDSRGRFEFSEGCAGAGMLLVANHPRHLEGLLEFTSDISTDLEIVLEARAATEAASVWGVVIDPDGQPVEDAHVAWGAYSARTDSQGHFEIDDLGPGPPHQLGVTDGYILRAIKSGYLPAVVPLGQEVVSPVELQFAADPPASIEGLVLDESGQPVPQAIVWIADPTSFGMVAHHSTGSQSWVHATQESLLRGETPWARGTAADSNGRFRLEGLLQRTYQVLACSPHTFEGAAPTPVIAGADDARIVIPSDPRSRRVAGRFVSPSGAPIAGLTVSPRRTFEADKLPMGAPAHHAAVADPISDEDGRVVFERLVVEGTYFDFTLNGRFLPPPLELSALDDPGDFLYTIPLPCRMQVDATAFPGDVDRLSVINGDGEALSMLIHGGSFSYTLEHADLVEGLSSVLEIDERGQAVLLWDGENEVARQEVTLDPGKLTRVVF